MAIKELEKQKNFHLSDKDTLSLTFEAIKEELAKYKQGKLND